MNETSHETIRARALVAAVALLLGVIAAYWPVFECGFIWDDDRYVHANQLLRSLAGLRGIWLDPEAAPQYYPVVFTTFWLEYQIWGDDPLGYHLVNVLLHAANAMLVWRILQALEVPGAWIAAAIFALHPVHVESVAWVTERKNVLSGFFYLSSALAYLRHVASRDEAGGARRARRHEAASLALFFLALMSKTVAASLPAALLLVLWWKNGRLEGRDVRTLGLFLLIGAVFGLLTAWLERSHVGALGADWDFSIVERSLIAGRAVFFYLEKLLWPHPLVFFYPRWEIDATIWWQYLYPTAAVGLVLGLWLARDRIGRGPLVALLFFGGTLLPALGFLNVYPMLFSFVADHFQYLASLGPIALFTALIHTAARRLGTVPRRAAAAGLLCLLALYVALIWLQIPAYTSKETLWRDTMRKNPDAFLAHYNLAKLLRARGDLDGAIHHYGESRRIKPDYVRAQNNLSLILAEQGRTTEALAYLLEAVELKPGDHASRYNLGTSYLELGRVEDAIDQLQYAARLRPDDYETHHNLAVALERSGRTQEARSHLRISQRLRNDAPQGSP